MRHNELANSGMTEGTYLSSVLEPHGDGLVGRFQNEVCRRISWLPDIMEEVGHLRRLFIICVSYAPKVMPEVVRRDNKTRLGKAAFPRAF